MKKNMILLFVLTVFSVSQLKAQSFITNDDFLVNGFSKKISGLDYNYHSCIPGLRESILTRATSGKDFLEWETGPLTIKPDKKYVAFTWISAIGSSPGKARMDLSTSNGLSFSFYTDGRPDWTINDPSGAMLSFHSVMVDQYGDHHGYMVLRIPAGKIEPGTSLIIKVTGSESNLTSWYMTFRKQVKTTVELTPFPAILKSDGNPLQLVEASVFYFGKESQAKIFSGRKQIATMPLNMGYNSINLGLPEVKKPSKTNIRLIAGDFSISQTILLQPVRKWRVDLIQHTHTDIGYTRSQTEILAEHLRYIDYALDYCDATDNYPDNAKFRWTCEASWPVDEYLKTRPEEQIKRLIARIREGRIEVTGMYFNFDELPDEQILAASLEAVGRIKDKGIPVTLAMQDDVNGIGWCLNDYFNQMGIKYLNMGTHGHRALICFDKPTMFWWESPSGKRLLTFRAEHYMTGNTVFEMQTGDMNKFRNNLLNYLKDLELKKYPFDEIAIQHSGYLTDNSPPSTIASELIKKWNDIFEWPKLSTSVAETFFHNMEREHSAEFPVIKGAWPDWWTDGFGSAARETAVTRKAATSLLANMGALSMAALSGITVPEEINNETELADNALLFYTEHTTGYSESVREPYSQPTMEQRALKESYAWEANRRTASAGEGAMGLLQSKFVREKDPVIIVFNTLNWERSGLATIYIDHQLVPMGTTAGIFDSKGNRMPSQEISQRSDGTYWMVWLQDIPAFGYKKFLIHPLKEDQQNLKEEENPVLENKWYKITPDLQKGTIKSLFDKDAGAELLDPASEYGMGEFILEQLGNRSQMESRRLDDFRRIPLDTVWFDTKKTGPVFNSIKFYGESETAIAPRGFSIEIRLFNNEKRIEVVCSIIKKSITDPESFYIAFPFNIESGKHFTEVQGGVIETGKDQITGSANDWYTVQNFTSVKNSDIQVVLGCSEMPLMQFGAINTGRYQAGATPQSTHLFSWPMNNYWVTNFNADQRGGHTWTYYITSSSDISEGFASRFGWGSRVPFLTRILPGQGSGNNRAEGSFISGWPSNIILISAKPVTSGKFILLHVRETDGKEASLNLSDGYSGKSLAPQEVDATGHPALHTDTILKPYESKFYLIRTGL
jgi:alpha-mannosidase